MTPTSANLSEIRMTDCGHRRPLFAEKLQRLVFVPEFKHKTGDESAGPALDMARIPETIGACGRLLKGSLE